ncbi:hypothetical protein lerEdw1_020076, partial [Lerista edwardsae]
RSSFRNLVEFIPPLLIMLSCLMRVTLAAGANSLIRMTEAAHQLCRISAEHGSNGA